MQVNQHSSNETAMHKDAVGWPLILEYLGNGGPLSYHVYTGKRMLTYADVC